MARIFDVTVVDKENLDGKTIVVQAKDDVAARQKAIKIWVRKMNAVLRKARAQDKEDGESPLPVYTYTEKDVSYCEISHLTDTDE